MYTAATPSMAAAVTSAGAFGFFGAGTSYLAAFTSSKSDSKYLGPDSSQKLHEGLRAAREYLHLPAGAPLPIGLGFLGFLLDKTEASDDPRLPAVLEELPMAIWFAFSGGDLGRYIKQVRAFDSNREHKTAVFVMINSVEEAQRAATEWKVDGLIVQGNEAGGHGAADAPPLLSLLQAVLFNVSHGPAIVAAGGISTGAQIAALLAMGADGVVLGSRLLCTPESTFSAEMKQEILKAGINATARSYAFDDVARTRFFPDGIDGRAIANEILVDSAQGLDLETRLKKYDEAIMKGETNRLVIWAGAGIGFVKDEKDTASIVKDIHKEILLILEDLPKRLEM
ncbi:hypothetical protein H0H92_011249 [Tricholoma furcatifolium]|nr:hypothetical protein H0H92_011249 [Tricholoma furcatifolium]